MDQRSFKADNQAYEAWLRTQCEVVGGELKYKHERMRKSPFIFLRATYFRWARRIEDLCPELIEAPRALCVGDIHVENFGTWRDDEGRLIWGVNDFDEAAEMPYAYDLVRLAVSACLWEETAITAQAAAAAVLKGYREGLAKPHAVVLDEKKIWMRPFVACDDDERAKFWSEIDKGVIAEPPKKVKDALRRSLPADVKDAYFIARPKRGGGSLGRPRYAIVAGWRGGRILREAKALVPSAWDWAHYRRDAPIRFTKLSQGAYRAPDPFLKTEGKFVLRRIAPDARKVELGEEGRHLSGKLLQVMGFDLGALHAASKNAARDIGADLDARPKDWLSRAATAAEAAVRQDYAAWRARAVRKSEAKRADGRKSGAKKATAKDAAGKKAAGKKAKRH